MRLLLHVCCGPCAIYPVEVLGAQGHQVTGFFHNPNIHPYLEFRRRSDAVREFAARVGLEVIYRNDYQLEEFLAEVAPRPDRRCDYCYRSRLEETARLAAAEGFDGFSTTLLYSRYQQHEKIRTFGAELAERFGVSFLYQDFRPGWQQGIAASKSMGLYRQPYCGCIYSEKERYHPAPGHRRG
jgi:predicted adenine nucleotide alpha hydrolase (AANH) superfamily ATPase